MIASLTITAVFRSLIGLIPAALLATYLYWVSVFKIGLPLLALLFGLYIFGVTLGLLVTAGLLRFGPSFEKYCLGKLIFGSIGLYILPGRNTTFVFTNNS